MDADIWYKNNKDVNESAKLTMQKINNAVARLSMQKTVDVREISNWDIDAILNYIYITQHQLTRANAIIIYELAQKVANRYRNDHPEFDELVTTMFFFLRDLLDHMKREEQILFPMIQQLLKDNNQIGKGKYTTFGAIKEWVQFMEKEHQSSFKNLNLLKDLTNNYSPPTDASSLHKALLALMRKFENGLLLLINIENNILFPKAIAKDGEMG